MNHHPNTNKKQRLVTGLKWGLGGLIVWNLLRPEVKADIKDFVRNELNVYNQ